MSEPMERIAAAYLKEQKRARRWRIFFKSCWLIIVIAILVAIFSGFHKSRPLPEAHVSLVNLEGIIAEDAPANAERINQSLAVAFKAKGTRAVVLQINSPGGSPVQSDDIYQQIRYLEKQYPKIPLYAICTDICASGGYYVASAAKEIYANKMTLTGSIGVRADGFGFVDLLKKIGVQRRLYIAGKNKAFLDPFKPQNAYQVAEMEKLLSQAHQVFIDAVKTGRGKRLDNKAENIIFSGMPFSGIQAKKYGLIDDFASLDTLKHDQFKNLPIVNYTKPLPLLDEISSKLGTEVSYQAASLAGIKLH